MKPDYVVPTMAEVAKLRGSNGYKVVSTFSGCGGSCLGLEMAGFEVLFASEFIEKARETYALNHPGVHIDERDIRDVKAEDILEQIQLKKGELDVLEGSPPCSAFSTAGRKEQGWGKVKGYSDSSQRVDDLFFEYSRLVNGLQPKVFVAENVSGLVKGSAKGYFKMILRELQNCGYTVEAKLLNSQWLGVPQARQRIIFMGVRNDLGVKPSWPKPLPYSYTIRDACPWITNHGFKKEEFGAITTKSKIGKIDIDKPAAVFMSEGYAGVNFQEALLEPPQTQDERTEERSAENQAWYDWIIKHGHPEAPSEETNLVDISKYAIGREWLRLKPGGQSSKYFSLIRTDANQPVGTITQTAGSVGAAGVTHPSEPRKFTIPEVRRLCSFPDDFILTGSFSQRWERLGRSVPPLMMKAVAVELQKILEQTK